MLSLVVVISLAGLVQWTDADGVVHVDDARRAPRDAKPLTDDFYSRVDLDGRPQVLSDGGTRFDDSTWWRARFATVRAELHAAQRRESDARDAVDAARREVCATATAEATSSVRVFSRSAGPVVVTTRDGSRRQVALAARQAVDFSDAQQTTTRSCVAGQASAAQLEALREATTRRSEAEAAVRSLERAANDASVPLSVWR